MGLTRVRRSFSSRYAFYCPACLARKQEREFAWATRATTLALLALTLAGLVGFAFSSAPSAWLSLNVAAATFFVLMLIVPHELGHALGAFLVGWRVFKIALGLGSVRYRFRLFGLPIELGTWPVGGFTFVGPKDVAFYRLKSFLVTLAGPAVNLAILALAIYSIESRRSFNVAPEGRFDFPWVLTCSNAWILLASLVPHRITLSLGWLSGKIPNDGLALLSAPFLSRATVRERHAASFALGGFECFQGRNYEAARKWHQAGLELYPKDVYNLSGMAIALLFLKDFSGARESYLRALQSDKVPPMLRAALLNNVAWTDLMLGGSEFLDEADRFSSEAIADYPNITTIQGTRGSVLIDRGEVDQGLPLVQAAFEGNEDPRLKALNACYLALGQIRKTEWQQARDYRGLARRLDPDCVLLPRVDRALRTAE